LQLAATNW